jgi:Peptidase A4 family
MLRRLSLLSALLAASGVAAADGAGAAAAATSTNWAGYVVTGKRFRHVSGTWVQPAASCTAGAGSSYSASWVGLGGNGSSSQSLEQLGTEADCTASGRSTITAWYELVPADMVRIRMAVHAGDTMSASVSVRGRSVQVKLVDDTTGSRFSRALRMSAPDVSSAEWIEEAPSECGAGGECLVLPLADFGTVTFSHASATTASGHTGAIADPAFTATAINLASGAGGRGPLARGADPPNPAGSALTGALASAGNAFLVSFVSSASGTPAGGPGTGQPLFGATRQTGGTR